METMFTLKLERPCMLGAEISWCMTDKFLANVENTCGRDSPILLQNKKINCKQLVVVENDFHDYYCLQAIENWEDALSDPVWY